jgi:hypothetical protein
MRGAGGSAAATDLARSAVDAFRQIGGGDGARLAEYLLAALHADAGAVTARSELQEVLELAHRAGDTEVHALTLDALARLDASAGHVAEARSRIAEADVLAEAAPFRWARNRVDRERARAELDPIGPRPG